MELQDAVVLVTGASSGIGAATARAAADAGAKVVLTARRSDRIEALAAELPDALAVPTDVTREGDRERAVEQTLARYGRVDALITPRRTAVTPQAARRNRLRGPTPARASTFPWSASASTTSARCWS